MSNEFQHGLCGCCDNCKVCMVTYCCPCYTMGKIGEKVGGSCLLCGLSTFVPILQCFCAASNRQKIRTQKNISGSFLGDLAVHFCCPLCALVQDAQEVNAIGSLSIARE